MPADDTQRTSRNTGYRPSLADAALVLVLLTFFWEWLHNSAQIDDAYISYRYADNLASGNGLVFNRGEYVEGITNLLWTLLLAAGVALGQSAPDLGSALGLLFGAATLIATSLWARQILDDPAAATVAPALVYLSTPFIAWTTCGMETPLFAWAVTWSLMAAAANRFGLASAGAIVATLVRPDGVLVAGAIFLVWLVEARHEKLRGWQWPALYATALVALTGFRLAYYGSPVPNTFYAKVGGVPPERGIIYIWDFLCSGAGLLLPMALFAALRDTRLRSAGLLVLLVFMYNLAVGGDIFMHSRFFLPIMPALAILALRGTEFASTQHRWASVGAVTLIVLALWIQPIGLLRVWPPLVACGLAIAAGFWTSEVSPWRTIAATSLAVVCLVPVAMTREAPLEKILPPIGRNRALMINHVYYGQVEKVGALTARRIKKLRQQPTLIAATGLGVFGYFVELPVFDIFGLVDPTIARSSSSRAAQELNYPGHQRSNADVVLARRPDLIVIPQQGKPVGVNLPAFVDLGHHPVLQSDYVWDQALHGYRRSAFLPERNASP